MIWLMVDIKIWLKEQNQAFQIASDPKYDGYEIGLASIVYRFLDKKSAGS